jgi:hypothetical protein
VYFYRCGSPGCSHDEVLNYAMFYGGGNLMIKTEKLLLTPRITMAIITNIMTVMMINYSNNVSVTNPDQSCMSGIFLQR